MTANFSKMKNPEQQPILNPSPNTLGKKMGSVSVKMAASMKLTKTGDHSANKGS